MDCVPLSCYHTHRIHKYNNNKVGYIIIVVERCLNLVFETVYKTVRRGVNIAADKY